MYLIEILLNVDLFWNIFSFWVRSWLRRHARSILFHVLKINDKTEEYLCCAIIAWSSVFHVGLSNYWKNTKGRLWPAKIFLTLGICSCSKILSYSNATFSRLMEIALKPVEYLQCRGTYYGPSFNMRCCRAQDLF